MVRFTDGPHSKFASISQISKMCCQEIKVWKVKRYDKCMVLEKINLASKIGIVSSSQRTALRHERVCHIKSVCREQFAYKTKPYRRRIILHQLNLTLLIKQVCLHLDFQKLSILKMNNAETQSR